MAHQDRNALAAEIQDDVSRDEIAMAFQAAMTGHFRAHAPGTGINAQTLLAGDYLNHFLDLAARFDALSADAGEDAWELTHWRPLGYEEHFAQSGSPNKGLAIAAYARVPAEIRSNFDDAVARLQAEALRCVARASKAINGQSDFAKTCSEAAARIRTLVDEAGAIANGQMPAKRNEAQDQTEIISHLQVPVLTGTA